MYKIHESELDTSRDSKSLMKRSLADIKLALFSSLKISYFGSLHKEIDQRMPIYNQQFLKTPSFFDNRSPGFNDNDNQQELQVLDFYWVGTAVCCRVVAIGCQ